MSDEASSRAPAEPQFNPFAALGLTPSATATDLKRARDRATRHRHEGILIRHPATANRFPSQAEVNEAYDYLSFSQSHLRSASRRWRLRHRDVFNPLLPLGHPDVFLDPATPARPSAATTPSWQASRPAANATASASRPSTNNTNNSRPRAAPSSNAPGGSANPFSVSSDEDSPPATASGGRPPRPYGFTPTANKFSTGTANATPNYDDDDDDDDYDEIPSSPTPAPHREPRPYGGTRRESATANATAEATMISSDEDDDDDADDDNAMFRPSATRPLRTANRSGGNGTRQTSIPNPITNERITVGEWQRSSGVSRNAVIAGFDARGRLFYRITNTDLGGASVAAPTATATRFEDIIFRAPYANMNAAQVRMAIDAHLRMNPYARP